MQRQASTQARARAAAGPSALARPPSESAISETQTDVTSVESDDAEHIKVCVRLRPLSREEEQKNEKVAWSWSENRIKQEIFPSYSQKGRREGTAEAQRQSEYQFDALFTPEHDTEFIYQHSVRNVVLAAMNGFHGSVFTYGQTSTGKTHTMQGTSNAPGIIPLAVYECFNFVEECPYREFLYRVSYLEVYNEQIHDLLNPEASGIKIVDHPKLGAVAKGVKEQVVMTPEHVFGLISGGEAHRHIGTTNVNEKSSRAHTIFRLIIESKDRDRAEREAPVRVSVLNLVDLAGSENSKMADTSGQRLQEARYINQSLLTLSTVIQRLSDTRRSAQSQHIPYRDSKLTRLLQNSLSGNAYIAIICTTSPATRCLEETHNTLKFATRAKRIKHRAHVNEVVNHDTLLRQYKAEIDQLRAQLAELQERAAAAPQEVEDDATENDSDTEALISQSISKLERLILRADKRDDIDSRTSSPVRAFVRENQSLGGSAALPGETPFFKKKRRSGSDIHAIALALHRDIGREFNGAAGEDGLAGAACSPIKEESQSGEDLDEDAFFQRRMRARHKSVGNLRRPRDSGVQDDMYSELYRVLETLKQATTKREDKRGSGRLQGPLQTPSKPPPASEGASSNEIEQLRQKLEAQQADWSLSRADNQFLQEQLDARNKLIDELSEGLKGIEENQTQLEEENQQLGDEVLTLSGELEACMKANRDLEQQVEHLKKVLKSREQEIAELKGLAPDDETF